MLSTMEAGGLVVVVGRKVCLGCDYARCKRMGGQANSYNRGKGEEVDMDFCSFT